MKKRFSKVKINIKRIKKNAKIFFIFFILLFLSYANNSLAQIPLNSFGQIVEINNSKELYDINTFDIDKDGEIDIIGLDSTKKFLCIYFGKGANRFENIKRYELSRKAEGIYLQNIFSKQHTNLIVLYKLQGKIDIYTFFQRRIEKTSSISIGYYVDALLVNNLNDSPSAEILSYGKNYRGISIISFDSTNYRIKRIDTTKSFSQVKIFNSNSDKYFDILALETNNTIHVYLNNNSYFNKSFQKKYNFPISYLDFLDINDDYYSDLIIFFGDRKHAQTLIGNGYGYFTEHNGIAFSKTPTKVILSDFTKDNLIDIIFYDDGLKCFYLKVLSENFSYYLEIPLFKVINLLGFKVYRTLNQKGIVLSEKGKSLKIILNSPIVESDYGLAYGIQPRDLSLMEDSKSFYDHLTWFDEYDNSFVLLKLNENSLPSKIYRINLLSKYNNYSILYHDDNLFECLFFNKDDYFLEYAKVTISPFNVSKKSFSFKGKIISAQLMKNQSFERKLVVLLKRTDNYFASFICPECIQQQRTEELISTSKINNFCIVNDEDIEAHFWKEKPKENKYELINYKFFNKSKDLAENSILSFNSKQINNIESFKIQSKTISKIDFLSICNLERQSIVITGNTKTKNVPYTIINVNENIYLNNELSGKFIPYFNKFYYYNSQKNNIFNFTFSKHYNGIKIEKVHYIENLKSFVVFHYKKNKINIFYIDNDRYLKRIIQ